MFRRLSASQLTADLIVAVLFWLVSFLGQLHGALWSDLVALTLVTAGLAVRRLSPGLALGLAWLACIVQMVAHGTAPSSVDIAVLPILYATGRYGGRILRWLGLGSAVLGAVIAAVYLVVLPAHGLTDGASALSFLITLFGLLAVLCLSWTLGLLAWVYRRAQDSRQAQRTAEQDAALEHERNRIARDMHDVVAHSLAVVIAQADGARYARQNDPDAVDAALGTIAGTAREALAEVRVLLGQLRHSQGEAPQPALADLDRLLDQLTAAGLAIERSDRGTAVPLAAGQQLALYRIAQEALTNALRHGAAGRAHLGFDWEPDRVVLTVSNRADERAGNPDGHGVAGMTERAMLAGGSLEAGRVGTDWVVIATLPIGPVTTGADA